MTTIYATEITPAVEQPPRGYEVSDGCESVQACMRCYIGAIVRVNNGHVRCSCCVAIMAAFKCEICGRDA